MRAKAGGAARETCVEEFVRRLLLCQSLLYLLTSARTLGGVDDPERLDSEGLEATLDDANDADDEFPVDSSFCQWR